MLLELNKIIGIRRVIPNSWGPPQHLPPPISSHGRRRTLTLQLLHGRSVVALLVALALRARLRRSSPVRAASTTCSWSRRGSRSPCRPRSLAWVGGRFSPSRCFRLRRRTDRPIGLELRHAHSRRHLEPLQDLSRSRIDPPQVALVNLPSAVPELSVDPGDPGDEAVGPDDAKNRPCLGIDQMDIPVPIQPHAQASHTMTAAPSALSHHRSDAARSRSSCGYPVR